MYAVNYFSFPETFHPKTYFKEKMFQSFGHVRDFFVNFG